MFGCHVKEGVEKEKRKWKKEKRQRWIMRTAPVSLLLYHTSFISFIGRVGHGQTHTHNTRTENLSALLYFSMAISFSSHDTRTHTFIYTKQLQSNKEKSLFNPKDQS